jgi:septal ring factor EnvC (AmiA/AmiB activator)
MNKKIAGLTSFLLCLCAIPAASVWADASSEERKELMEVTRSQIEEIEKHLSEQQGELFTVDAKEKDLLGEIERLEMELARNTDALREVSSRIQEVEDAIEDGQDRVHTLNRSLRDAQDYLTRRLIAFYKFGKIGYMALLMGADTLQELEKSIRYMSSIMDRDSEVLDRVEEKRRQVEREVAGLEENKVALELLRKAKDARGRLLERHMESRVYVLMKARREKEFYEKAVKELKQAAQELNQTMGGLEKEEKEISQLEGLAHMKGALPVPLQGEIVRNLHTSGSSPFMHKKGVFITGSEGEAVLSVFPGRVDYSGWFKGYGQLMVINHGEHYFTLFAHLHKRAREKGEMISGGEPVGIAGDPGWNLGPGVYFEIRRGGEHLDPEKWLQVK